MSVFCAKEEFLGNTDVKGKLVRRLSPRLCDVFGRQWNAILFRDILDLWIIGRIEEFGGVIADKGFVWLG